MPCLPGGTTQQHPSQSQQQRGAILCPLAIRLLSCCVPSTVMTKAADSSVWNQVFGFRFWFGWAWFGGNQLAREIFWLFLRLSPRSIWSNLYRSNLDSWDPKVWLGVDFFRPVLKPLAALVMTCLDQGLILWRNFVWIRFLYSAYILRISRDVVASFPTREQWCSARNSEVACIYKNGGESCMHG